MQVYLIKEKRTVTEEWQYEVVSDSFEQAVEKVKSGTEIPVEYDCLERQDPIYTGRVIDEDL